MAIIPLSGDCQNKLDFLSQVVKLRSVICNHTKARLTKKKKKIVIIKILLQNTMALMDIGPVIFGTI